jgi:ADP-heptose:LPS heptosyltransferase
MAEAVRRSFFSGQRAEPVAPKNSVAFVALAEIGALVLAHSSIEAARRAYPDGDVYFITFPQCAEMLGIMGFDDAHIVTIESASISAFLRSLIGVTKRLRKLGLAATINLEVYTRFPTLLAWASGAPARAGFYGFHDQGSYTGRLTTHRVIYNSHIHVTKSYVALVQALSGLPGAEPAPKVVVDDLPVERFCMDSDTDLAAALRTKLVAKLTKPLNEMRVVILNSNASDLIPVRRWSADNYVALAGKFLSAPDIAVVLIGGPTEVPAAEALASRIDNPNAISLAGQTSLRELIELFHLADLLISNDSGTAHFASISDIPSLILFGPETPAIFGPVGPNQEAMYLGLSCSPCVSPHNQKRSSCTDNQCMKGFSVDAIYASALGMLDQHSRANPAVRVDRQESHQRPPFGFCDYWRVLGDRHLLPGAH